MSEKNVITKEDIPGYVKYGNDAALYLAIWALEENDRVKASKLKKVADKMEDKYRDSRKFYNKKKINTVRSVTYMKDDCLYYRDLIEEYNLKHEENNKPEPPATVIEREGCEDIILSSEY